MSDDFDDFFFADSPSFSPDESGDKQFLKTPSSGFHETINTSTLNDDDFEWFIGKAGADGYQNDSGAPEISAGEDWFFSDPSSYEPGIRSAFDDIILSTRNGSARKVMTSLSDFTGTLAKLGVEGPKHFKTSNLDSRGRVIGVGSQFTVFIDKLDVQDRVVMKRVNKIFLDTDVAEVSSDDQLRSHFRTLELEILSLCHPPLRDHRNIVDIIAWGYDYPTPDVATCLPFLMMEKAMCSLSEFLQSETKTRGKRLSWEIKHQLCLDISEGLAVLHRHGIVHGDVKPDNVLVFKQDNPNVPYLGKLSDFGVCIFMEETCSLSFQSYLGTPGWIPPEVIDHQEDLHGRFSPELLLKCDCFSYGLVVLSVLITGGRPPFSNMEEEEDDEEEDDEEEESPYEKAMGLIFSNEDESFPQSLQSKLISLCTALFKEKPQDRADLSHLLLADNSKGYSDWIFAKETARKQTRVRVEGRRAMDTNKGPAYWISMDNVVFEQLEQHFSDTDTDSGPGPGPVFPGETLFGMAIRLTVSRTPGFEKKILVYMGAAAKRSFSPAQAIIKRLYEAHGLSLATIADDQLMESWLFNAVSTGSLIAEEDLADLNPDLLQKAKASFRETGGHNGGFSNLTTPQTLFSNLDVDTARNLCDEKGNVEFLVDLEGNRLLHMAAMFDKHDVIKYLVEERGATINCQNDRGETPLYNACLAGHRSTVEVLITLSADASIISKPYGLSPLHWLFNFEKQHIPHIAHLLISKGKAKVNATIASEKVGNYEQQIPFEHFPFYWPFGTPLHWAAFARSVTAIDALLSFGADINRVDSKTEDEAQTALAMAARRGDSKIVQYLLEKGANPKYIDGLGRNPFHMMALNYNSSNRLLRFWEGFQSWVYNRSFINHLAEVRKCVLAIRDAGGNLNGRRDPSVTGNTPLIDAANTKDCALSLALIETGADASCLERDSQRSLLHIWADVENSRLAYPEAFPTLFQTLINSTKDLHAKEAYRGDTVLHRIVNASSSITEEEFEERICVLTTQDRPININITNDHGTTPLMQALSSRSPGSAETSSKILLRFGARIDFKADEDSRDFIFIICENPILTDSESLRLLKMLLDGFSEAEKREMACSSVANFMGAPVTALAAAIQEGKYYCIKYLLELGVDPNMVDKGGATPLDWALHQGEETRRKLLITLTEGFSVSERKEALEKGSAFGVTYSHIVFGTSGLTREKYFSQPKIINHFLSLGAKRAKNLTQGGRTILGSTGWDADLVEDSDGWYTVETQPYYEEWKVLYRLSC